MKVMLCEKRRIYKVKEMFMLENIFNISFKNTVVNYKKVLQTFLMSIEVKDICREAIILVDSLNKQDRLSIKKFVEQF